VDTLARDCSYDRGIGLHIGPESPQRRLHEEGSTARSAASSPSTVSLSQMFSGHQQHQLRTGLVQQPVQIVDRFAITI
jgi:hypothetical protein